MKYFITIMLLMAISMGLGAVNLQLSGGLDFAGESGSMVEDVFGYYIENNMATTISLQAQNNFQNVLYGLGVDYQVKRQHVALPEGMHYDLKSSSFIPVYGVLGYQFLADGILKPEMFAQLGYSFTDFTYDMYYPEDRLSAKAGLYCGVGMGVQIQNIIIQGLYRVNNYKFTSDEWNGSSYDNETYDGRTRQFNISIGYRLEGLFKNH
ncbi:MAG: hypothetical protein RBS43_06940 [Candidatus Cloacimonas sp.]|jgi:hypothetical protein|nr:hypothetical protein [Candidatus Cloacimonas sp.]